MAIQFFINSPFESMLNHGQYSESRHLQNMASNTSRKLVNENIHVPYLPYISEFEATFDGLPWLDWISNNWHVSLYFTAAYLALIPLGTKWMKNRKPFKLRIPMAMWSASLAFFSMLGASRFLAIGFQVWWYRGFFHTICNAEQIIDSRVILWVSLEMAVFIF